MSDADVDPDDMAELTEQEDALFRAFADDVRSAAQRTSLPVVDHALAAVLTNGLPGVDVVKPPVRRRRIGLRVAIAGLVAGMGFGGLGAAGALPDPVQRRVADVADVVGLNLPDPRSTTTTRPSSSTTTTEAPSTSNGQGRGNGRPDGNKGADGGRSSDESNRGGTGNGTGDDNGNQRGHANDPNARGNDDAGPNADRPTSSPPSRIPNAGSGVHPTDRPIQTGH